MNHPPSRRPGTGIRDGGASAVIEAPPRIAARPAATGYAFGAGSGTVLYQRAARACRAETAPGQARTQHHLLTFFSSAQVKPPFRGYKGAQHDSPDTIGTGNICSCRAALLPFQWAGQPGFPVCYSLRTPCGPHSSVARARSPRITTRAGMMRREPVFLTSCGSPLASFLPGSCCEAGPRRLGDSTARAGAHVVTCRARSTRPSRRTAAGSSSTPCSAPARASGRARFLLRRLPRRLPAARDSGRTLR
jgi:hypothetical protein